MYDLGQGVKIRIKIKIKLYNEYIMSNINAIYSLNSIPFFTYGMIGITTVVLAIVTMMDTDNKSFAKDEGYEKVNTDSSGSMFGSLFTSSEEAKKEGTEEKKDESMFKNPFTSSKDESKEGAEEKKDESILGNLLGSKEGAEEKKDESMFGNLLGSKEEKKEESMFGSKEEKKEESMFGNPFASDKPQQKQGGNRKTKHNKRQNTYTRRR